MKIKTLILACAFAGSAITASAQKGELSAAKSNYDKFMVMQGANTGKLAVDNLKTAKTSIDKAAAHEKTKNDPATWTYKALIYTDMALLDSTAASKPLITEAANAAKKAKELDKGGENKANLERVNSLLAQYEMNAGVKAYQANKFTDAYASFNNALAFRPGDTTIIYYAGLSAINAKDYKSGIASYEKLVKTNYSENKKIYLDLSRLYTMQGDTAKAISIASEGAAKFKADPALATQEIELSLMTGKQKEVISKINEQAQKDPKNKLYPFYLGIAYNSTGEHSKAEEAYKKAIAIDPNYADAYINLSGLMMNKGIELYNTGNKLPQNKQKDYEEAMKVANAEFDKAFPYLEKATTLSPKSAMAWENLKTYYRVKKNQAKVDEITQKINSLGAAN